MKRLLILFSAIILVLSLAVPCFAATDSGMIDGGYEFDTSVPLDFPDLGASNRVFFDITGWFEIDGVRFDLVRISVYTAGTNPVEISLIYDGANRSVTVYDDNEWQVLSLTVYVDEPYQINLSSSNAFTNAGSQYLFTFFRSAEWLDAPVPFFGTIGTAITFVTDQVGVGLTALTSGQLSFILPLVGLSVSVSLAVLVFKLFNRAMSFG